MKATYFFPYVLSCCQIYKLVPASFFAPPKYFSTPLIKFLLIMTAQGTESFKGLPQLDGQYKSIDKFKLELI